ncbi:amino acid-binding protein [Candidatus Bathyarchaeota archaeon]|nr:MAG: amino acid-binding protein [Candidatus Hecatellales archaeon]RLI35801.1 MAG: amino acid-binding protein [Candidatus Bathyarchaeota archaeon]
MWSKILKRFEGQPGKLAVVRLLIENGLSIRQGKIYCNELEISKVTVARAVKVDRRTVAQTIEEIEGDPELSVFFFHLRSAGHSLREVAHHLGFSVLEITPVNARMPGILAGASTLLAKRNLSIRQALVDDPELHPEPRLTLIVEGEIPGNLIPEILKVKGVARVSVY